MTITKWEKKLADKIQQRFFSKGAVNTSDWKFLVRILNKGKQAQTKEIERPKSPCDWHKNYKSGYHCQYCCPKCSQHLT